MKFAFSDNRKTVAAFVTFATIRKKLSFELITYNMWKQFYIYIFIYFWKLLIEYWFLAFQK